METGDYPPWRRPEKYAVDKPLISVKAVHKRPRSVDRLPDQRKVKTEKKETRWGEKKKKSKRISGEMTDTTFDLKREAGEDSDRSPKASS